MICPRSKKIKQTAYNTGFASLGLYCYYQSFVLKLKFVLLFGFSAGNPQRTQSPKTLCERLPFPKYDVLKNIKITL